jgi:hypothetical protein
MLDESIYLNLFKIVLVFSFAYSIYKTIQIYLLRRKYRHIPGPPANGLLGFYLGNVVDMPKYISNQKIYNDFIFDWYT